MQPERIREKASESGIVAALSASPMYRERPATAFDAGTLLDAELLTEYRASLIHECVTGQRVVPAKEQSA